MKRRIARPTTRGQRHYMATVSDQDVENAVAAYMRGEGTQMQIAKRLGVSCPTVTSWINCYNRTWGKG